jgi:hypothetical protein
MMYWGFFGARTTFLYTVMISVCSFDLQYWTTTQLWNITVAWMMIMKTPSHKIRFITYSTCIDIQHAVGCSTSVHYYQFCHIFIHREPLIVSLTILQHNVNFLQGHRAHALPLISVECEVAAAQARVANHGHQVDYVWCVCVRARKIISLNKELPLATLLQTMSWEKCHSKFCKKIPLKVPYKKCTEQLNHCEWRVR